MHSPLRSESDVFTAVVLVLLGVALAVVVGALTDATVGAVIAAALIGVAIGVLVRAGRGSLPEDVEIASAGEGRYRVLVIANQTVEGRELLEEIRTRVGGRERPQLMVVTPALPRSRLELIASDTDRARSEAEERLAGSLRALREAGIAAEGVTGDEDPVVAARDALREFGADELIVSTHPPESSRWLERGVVEQLRREVGIPLTHVIVEGKASRALA